VWQRRKQRPPGLELVEERAALLAMAFFAVANFDGQAGRRSNVMLAGWKFLASAWVT
jgi:hypothetical protein